MRDCTHPAQIAECLKLLHVIRCGKFMARGCAADHAATGKHSATPAEKRRRIEAKKAGGVAVH